MTPVCVIGGVAGIQHRKLLCVSLRLFVLQRIEGLAQSHDMRELLLREQQGDAAASLAIEAYVYRIRKYLGSYFVALGGRVDAIVFTGGIGENAAAIRQRCCSELGLPGIAIDHAKNTAASHGEISAAGSVTRIMVIPCDEALQIAKKSLALVASGTDQETDPTV